MSAFIQKQRTTAKHKHKLNKAQIFNQQLRFMNSLSLKLLIQQEMILNPALELEEDPIDEDFENIESDNYEDEAPIYNEEFDINSDEYETGTPDENYQIFYDIVTSLKQFASKVWSADSEKFDQALEDISFYEKEGFLPETSDARLQEELTLLENSVSNQQEIDKYPTFEVLIGNGEVCSIVIQSIYSRLKYKSGNNKNLKDAKKFIAAIQERESTLERFAAIVLESIQKGFFLQPNLQQAMLSLLPLPPKEIEKLGIETTIQIDKQYISKFNRHLVKCQFGVLPFGLFTQDKPAILRRWVKYAQDNSITKPKEIKKWIEEQMEKRVSYWSSDDERHQIIKPLLKLKRDDIKNARKKLKESEK